MHTAYSKLHGVDYLRNMKVLVVLFVVAVASVNCLPGGPPLSACNTLAPNPVSHGAQPQTTPAPYCVNPRFLYRNDSTFRYKPGCTYYREFRSKLIDVHLIRRL